jgi:hypothetical protein
MNKQRIVGGCRQRMPPRPPNRRTPKPLRRPPTLVAHASRDRWSCRSHPCLAWQPPPEMDTPHGAPPMLAHRGCCRSATTGPRGHCHSLARGPLSLALGVVVARPRGRRRLPPSGTGAARLPTSIAPPPLTHLEGASSLARLAGTVDAAKNLIPGSLGCFYRRPDMVWLNQMAPLGKGFL